MSRVEEFKKLRESMCYSEIASVDLEGNFTISESMDLDKEGVEDLVKWLINMYDLPLRPKITRKRKDSAE